MLELSARSDSKTTQEQGGGGHDLLTSFNLLRTAFPCFPVYNPLKAAADYKAQRAGSELWLSWWILRDRDCLSPVCAVTQGCFARLKSVTTEQIQGELGQDFHIFSGR
ncbi:hypothetical protein AMECASPLE_001457 [Ameca splendens]|uniref:Uncharacterized protein n=1 Tax=Ameca splendens TaxID=208324 RepID=A0ABV0XAU8_9TELE